MTFTKAQINEAAHTLRSLVDNKWEADVEREDEAFADGTCKDYYDAVTTLHEAAAASVGGPG